MREVNSLHDCWYQFERWHQQVTRHGPMLADPLMILFSPDERHKANVMGGARVESRASRHEPTYPFTMRGTDSISFPICAALLREEGS